MATSNLNTIRVRLYFDYPPPATPDCRMCWLLVDLNKCRVVADLSSIIKEKFGYSRKTILDLFIEDCYLPTTESIYIVRDNDSIRVKVSVFENGAETYQNCVAHNSKTKKREREDEMQICVTQGSSKKTKLDVQINGSAPANSEKKKKHKKKKEKQSANNPTTPQKNIPVKDQASQSFNRKKTSSVSTSDKTSRAKNQESTSSSSDSSEDESHSKPSPPKPKPKQSDGTKKPTMPAPKETSSSDSDSSDNTVKPTARKSSTSVQPLPATPKPSTSTNSQIPPQTPKQTKRSTDCSSSSSSSSSQRKPSAKKSQVDPQPSLTSSQSISASGSKNPQEEAESSDSDASEIELVIRKPNLQGMGLNIAGLNSSTSEAAGRPKGNARSQERGRGRGGNRGSGRGGFGRAKGTPWKQDFNYKYENGEHQKRRDLLINESFILQNPPEPEPEPDTAPKRDYTTLPLLAAPPAVGQTIAFKLLELTENYTPEVSDYKEGKIIAFNPQTQMLELELLSRPHAPAEPGKFDLVYEYPDGSEIVEYAVTHGSQLTERWDSLLEPRLIVENVG